MSLVERFHHCMPRSGRRGVGNRRCRQHWREDSYPVRLFLAGLDGSENEKQGWDKFLVTIW